MAAEDLLELERDVVEAWPAAETLDLDGWLLRHSGGPTHRGNSVATLAAGSALDLVERVERAEAWYRARQRPTWIQIGPCAAPTELDALLARRGYRVEGSARLARAPAQRVLANAATTLATRVEAASGAAWREIAESSSRFASSQQVLAGFLARLGSRCRFVTAWDQQGTPAAICLGIRSERRLGIYAMHTRPEQRRRGAARAVLHALAASALSDGLSELYLLVEPGNLAARALYAQVGFEDVYAYHYRIQSAAPQAVRGRL